MNTPILLVEDHPIFRFGVRQLILQRWPDAVIGEADSLAAALAEARRGHWQVAVVDLNLSDASGLESVTQLRRAAPHLRLLVLSLNTEEAYALRVLEQGAAGYLTKDRASEELIAALERVANGGRYITASLADRLANRALGESTAAAHEQLSPQEYRVMLQLADGRRITEIAEAMHLSPKTVTTYRARILEKLGVDNNVDVARYCLAQGLSDNPD